MKNFLGLLFAFSLFLFPGCGDSGTATNVAEDASADAIAEYEALIKAEEEAAQAGMEATTTE